jgi:hypothetical protein
VLTFPESRCKYIHFLQVYAFSSPINTNKIVLWYSELWYRVWYVGTDNLEEHTGFFFRGEIYDTTKFHKYAEFLRVNTSPFSVHWTAYNNHTPHKRKSPSQESLKAAGRAQNMEPSFYPCRIYASCPWHMGFSLTVSVQGVKQRSVPLLLGTDVSFL